MRVHFTEREQGPERLVCEAEIHFEEGPISGMRLVGFSLWRSPEGEVYVTFPSRAFGAGAERRFFDYLRAIDGTAEPVKRVKAWILDEYRRGLDRAACAAAGERGRRESRPRSPAGSEPCRHPAPHARTRSPASGSAWSESPA